MHDINIIGHNDVIKGHGGFEHGEVQTMNRGLQPTRTITTSKRDHHRRRNDEAVVDTHLAGAFAKCSVFALL